MAADDVSRYIEHLPAIFGEEPFLGRFLLAFERILSGLPTPDGPKLSAVPPGLEQILDRIHTYFDPLGPADGSQYKAPSDFLPWLAGWVATSLRDDWDDQTRRRFLAIVVSLYRRRGTKRGLQQLLEFYTGVPVEIVEGGDDAVNYFQVRFSVPGDPALLARQAAIATDVIDREKPAHTYYGLLISYPSLQITDDPKIVDGHPVTGVFVGVNTVLGERSFGNG